MAQYYYLISGLPEIEMEQAKLPFPLAEFKEVLKNNLTVNDYQELQYLFLQYDNDNLLNILQKQDAPFNELGIFDKELLEEELQTREIEPEETPSDLLAYIRNFAIRYKNDLPIMPGVRWENQLTAYYYDFARRNTQNDFLRNWFDFNMNLTNLDVAFTSAKYGFTTEQEIIGSNEVTNAILHTKTKDFGLGQEYDYVNDLLNAHENENMYNREKQIDLLKWKQLDEMNTFHYFTIEVVMAYFIKMQLLSRWVKLDEESGRAAFNKILDNLQSNYEFPKAFI